MLFRSAYVFGHQEEVRHADAAILAAASDPIGLDRRAFAACLAAPETLQLVVREALRADASGVEGTPSYQVIGPNGTSAQLGLADLPAALPPRP